MFNTFLFTELTCNYAHFANISNLSLFYINNNYEFVWGLYPEIVLTCGLLIFLLYGTYTRTLSFADFEKFNKTFEKNLYFFLFILLLLLFLYPVSYYTDETICFFISPDILNLKKIILFLAVSTFPLIVKGFRLQHLNLFEFYILYLFVILTSLLLISCGDLMAFFLLLEAQALCLYALAIFRSSAVFSVEGGMKYFIIGSVISGCLILIISLIYGFCNTTKLYLIHNFFIEDWQEKINHNLATFNILYLCITFVSCALICILAAKLGAVPFHAWIINVYETSCLSTTIIFSFIPKFTIFILILRFLNVFNGVSDILQFLLITLGFITSLIGAILTLFQTRIKRFFIYTSLVQLGFPLVLAGSYAIEHALIYIIIYLISSLLLWNVYILLYVDLEIKMKFMPTKNDTITSVFDTMPMSLLEEGFITNYSSRWGFIFLVIIFLVSGLPPFFMFVSKSLFYSTLTLINYNYDFISYLLFTGLFQTYYYIYLIVKIIRNDINKLVSLNYTNFNTIFLNKKNNTTVADINFDFWIEVIYAITLAILLVLTLLLCYQNDITRFGSMLLFGTFLFL
jgi:NADH-quinone oxidoreductase subunit N